CSKATEPEMASFGQGRGPQQGFHARHCSFCEKWRRDSLTLTDQICKLTTLTLKGVTTMFRARRFVSLVVLCTTVTILAAACHKKVPPPAPPPPPPPQAAAAPPPPPPPP